MYIFKQEEIKIKKEELLEKKIRKIVKGNSKIFIIKQEKKDKKPYEPFRKLTKNSFPDHQLFRTF